MPFTYHTIVIHPLAPAKVAVGETCNGCGVCCLFEPCPLGIVLSHTRRGACHALRWHGHLGQYRCGAVVEPEAVVLHALPEGLNLLAPLLAPLVRRWALRWIAAGSGCDSSLVVHTIQTPEDPLSDTRAGSKTTSAFVEPENF